MVALTDPRPRLFVPLPLLLNLTMCRFPHGHPSLRRMGQIPLKDQALLERLEVATAIGSQGYHRNGERQPYNEEHFSEVFRHLDPEPAQVLLAQAVHTLRVVQLDWFRKGSFPMNSNH